MSDDEHATRHTHMAPRASLPSKNVGATRFFLRLSMPLLVFKRYQMHRIPCLALIAREAGEFVLMFGCVWRDVYLLYLDVHENVQCSVIAIVDYGVSIIAPFDVVYSRTGLWYFSVVSYVTANND